MKRAITCGSTAMMTTDRNGEPVARTASTWLHRHFLDRLGDELREEAERGDDQRQHAGKRAEADRFDEQDRDDDRMETAEQRDQRPRGPGERRRREIARGGKSERQRQEHADHRRDDRDLQALDHAGIEQLTACRREIRRKHPRDELRAVAEADDESGPS